MRPFSRTLSLILIGTRSGRKAALAKKGYGPFFLADEDHLKIADVGVGWSGDDEIAERFEERIGVVVREILVGRADCRDPGAFQRRPVRNRAGRIGGPVDSVRARARDDDWNAKRGYRRRT